MGLLVNGVWHDQWYDTKKNDGKFVRDASRFRAQIAVDSAHPPEPHRYHLYVSHACPWAHRTLIFRELKGLQELISVSVVHPHMREQGWELKDERGQSSDALYGFDYLHQLYCKAQPDYSGRVTVPVLWDKKKETIVNNESADIIRIFNDAFNGLTGDQQDFYPQALRADIDEINAIIYHKVNNGVYRCGFATTQEAYEEAFLELFETLDRMEHRLSHQSWLVGDTLTEADWRFFTTLIRFDAVYFGHFKTNRRRIIDYPALSAYVNRLYHHPAVANTVHWDHIKQHYYYSHTTINPTQIVPLGPERLF
ncbi:MAG: glutathione S-transferase family protein [Legionellaceae bacterium]|nr:glutathione S-transferase family protein [Legionellaceae bacterium]